MIMSNSASLLLIVVAFSGVLASASIEREPVKVTDRNSGPKYDIDEVERTRVAGEQAWAPRVPFARPKSDSSDRASEDDGPVGHISIRRIFLVPVDPSDGSNSMWTNGRHSGLTPVRQGVSAEEPDDRSSLFAGQPKPFWPFWRPSIPLGLSPATDGHHPHLLGGDEASRSPTAEQPLPSSSEREDSSLDRRRPMMDPIQLMLDLFNHAMISAGQSSLLNDLNKTTQDDNNNTNTETIKSSSSDSNQVGTATGDFNKSIKPTSTNETKEEIVEIEGKKYLCKTVINRHVGENIVFMTKRLIFTPLNETDSAVPTSSPAAPSSTERSQTSSPRETTVASVASEPTTTLQPSSTPEAADKAGEPATSSSEVPTSITTQAITVSSSPEETTTGKESLIERVSGAVERVAERLVEKVASDLPKSSSTNSTVTI